MRRRVEYRYLLVRLRWSAGLLGRERLMLESARSMVDSSCSMGKFPDMIALDMLRQCTMNDAKRLADGDRQVVLAGMLMARIRSGDEGVAAELADAIRESLMNRGGQKTPVESCLALEAALAETYVSQGNTVRSIDHSLRLLSFEGEHVSPGWQHRVRGIAAASFALDGDHHAAERMLKEIHSLESRDGWNGGRVEFMQAIAETILSFTAMDAARLRALLPGAKAILRNEPSALSLVRLIEALGLFFDGEMSAALVEAGRVARGAEHPSGPAIIRECALGLEAIIHVMRGAPAQAIALLRDAPDSPMHIVCFASIRSSAYLILGDYRSARQSTDDCLRNKTLHSRWTLPVSLLQRAIANMLLGNIEDAAREGSEALEYSRCLDPSLGICLVPHGELRTLGRIILTRYPTQIGRLRRIIPKMRTVPRYIAPECPLPHLSRREQLIAYHMRSNRSYGEIAAELHVTLSTVKTQAVAVFRKMAVTSREDAVGRLERAGFYELYFPSGEL